jgi:hypothetical protein
MKRFYRGWSIYHCPNAPITGQYQAVKFGVKIGSNTEEMVIRMIDQRLPWTPDCT